MRVPHLGSLRQTILVAAVALCPALPSAAQPPRPAGFEEQAPTPDFSASSAQASRTASPAFTTLYRPEVFLGWASAWRGPSKTDLGPSWSNLGGGVGVRVHRRIGVEFELSHSLESSLRDVHGLHQGVTSTTFGSAKALVYLAPGRVQPYLGLGLGLVWQEGVAPTYCTAGNPPVCDFTHPAAEARYRSTDTGGSFSAGARIALAPRIFVKPEFGAYAGLVRRVSIAGGYQF